jgi:uncharacterized membrane protein
MNDRDFQSKLGELMAMIETAPEAERDRLRELADETKTRHERMRKTVAQLQESLDYLRLSVKYLVFDLEATRRENAYLRKLLQNGRSAGGEC